MALWCCCKRPVSPLAYSCRRPCLSVAGYLTPTDAVPVPVQPETALHAIRLFIGPIPAVILLVSLVVAYFYPITRQRHARIVRMLERRRERRHRLTLAPTVP